MIFLYLCEFISFRLTFIKFLDLYEKEYPGYRLTANGRYGCHKCISSYKNLNNLRRHLRFECDKEPAFVCEVCDRRFTYKYILVRHMTTHNV